MINIRQFVFWGLDFLKGGSIRKNYNEIKKNESLTREKYLNEILDYAVEHVPFYKNGHYKSFTDFPIINKPIFKREGARCISDEYPNYESLYKVKTSGSTGTPLVVYLDHKKRQRVIADLLVINDRIGWTLGSHYVFLRNWTSNYQQSKLSKIAKNFKAVGVGDFSDIKKAELYTYLLEHKNTILVGYSSSVCDFMDWIKRTGRNAQTLRLKLIHCSAEELLEYKRKELREIFACPVYNRYSNEEIGLIAMMMDDSEVFLVNTASIRVELLKLDKDEYVQPGEIGRVVITDLLNHAMPIIRYDVGDLAISNDKSDDVKTITKLCGRSADVLYAPGGILIGSTTLAAVAEVFPNIEKWQFAQVSDERFEFRYVGNLTGTEKNELKERLQMSIGKFAFCEIIEQQNIPLCKNGKYKTLVNENNK